MSVIDAVHAAFTVLGIVGGGISLLLLARPRLLQRPPTEITCPRCSMFVSYRYIDEAEAERLRLLMDNHIASHPTTRPDDDHMGESWDFAPGDRDSDQNGETR
ncbi:hypothetical protein [Streptomyces erythrochromogenes]|uniref:hypothetical protein n=1 Tax=Streptomyces erythrochromogenes TaxID=285574 RepID=UPI002252E822|nr:hypothetical protein [Streptomyces erythrochromogenes]MCX5586043.1 hypothetical protein [Streptomyces erythrochromogenes]